MVADEPRLSHRSGAPPARRLILIPPPAFRRSSRTASYIASRFSAGRSRLDVVDGVEDEPAAGGENRDPLADLLGALRRGVPKGKRLLGVDAAAPEGEPLAEALS